AGQEARGVVEKAGLTVERIDVQFELDMHYLGQTHTVAVPLKEALNGGSTGISETSIRAAFETAYAASFSRLLPGIPVRIVSLRTVVTGRRPAFDLSVFAPGPGASREAARKGTRPVWIGGKWQDATIWSRLDLPVGAVVEAPAVLEQPDATIFIDPGLQARVDALGNLIVKRAP